MLESDKGAKVYKQPISVDNWRLNILLFFVQFSFFLLSELIKVHSRKAKCGSAGRVTYQLS